MHILSGIGLLAAAVCTSASAVPQDPRSFVAAVQEASFDQVPLLKKHDDLFDLHKHLVEIPSISYNELEVGQWLSKTLEKQGYTTEFQEVAENRFNIFAYPGKKRDARTLVTSHIDTVPPFIPYESKKNGSTTIISGRGSVDAKASVAAQIVAVNELLKENQITPNDVALLFVVGEEISGDGMRAANDLKLKPKTVIFGEPTELKLASGHKGNLSARLKAFGKAAHSGYPWLGRSANEVLIKALHAIMLLGEHLPRSEKYGNTTINIGKIEGGVAPNVVAERAEASVTFRIAAGTAIDIKSKLLKTVNDAVKEFRTGDDEEVIAVEFAAEGYGPVDLDADVSGFDVITVNYGTDVPNLDKTVDGQKRYLYGPGSILVAHSDHEAIDADDLKEAVKGYKKLILHSLQL